MYLLCAVESSSQGREEKSMAETKISEPSQSALELQ
jgi:hypothetical protein